MAYELRYKIYELNHIPINLEKVQLRTGPTLEKAIESLLSAKKMGNVKAALTDVIIYYKTQAGYEAMFFPKEELFRRFERKEFKEVKLK